MSLLIMCSKLLAMSSLENSGREEQRDDEGAATQQSSSNQFILSLCLYFFLTVQTAQTLKCSISAAIARHLFVMSTDSFKTSQHIDTNMLLHNLVKGH